MINYRNTANLKFFCIDFELTIVHKNNKAEFLNNNS